MDNRIVKKISRKVKRCEETLLKHENIRTSETTTNCLFIGNGGFGCNIHRELLMEVFSEFGAVESITMVPNKPYSFVVFRELGDAANAMQHINGHRLGSGHVFYMAYVAYENIPQGKPIEYPWPKGLVLLEDFLTEEDENTLIAAINVEDSKAILKHRRVKHYGYEFVYGSNNIDKSKTLEKIPDACLPHLKRLVALGYVDRIPDQLTVNHYLPGQGIPPHIDTHSAFEDGIVSISLGSQVVMDFSCPGEDSVPVLLPKRSALIMSGESRYRWKHGITPRKIDSIPSKEGFTLSERSTRTSLTFRIIRDGKCKCDYAEHCDSQQEPKAAVEEEVAKELEKLYVN